MNITLGELKMHIFIMFEFFFFIKVYRWLIKNVKLRQLNADIIIAVVTGRSWGERGPIKSWTGSGCNATSEVKNNATQEIATFSYINS